MPEIFTGSEQKELEHIEDIIGQEAWLTIRLLFKKHKEYLIEQAHVALEKHEDRKAGELLARSKEPDRIVELIRNRRDKLRKKQEDYQNGNDA